eukprot:1157487-Pelagomonas_calceolata.AAC.7
MEYLEQAGNEAPRWGSSCWQAHDQLNSITYARSPFHSFKEKISYLSSTSIPLTLPGKRSY